MALPKTKVLPISDYKTASPGMYRVVQWIESEPYQLDEEVATIEEALEIVSKTTRSEIPLLNASIYNDQGEQVKNELPTDILKQVEESEDDIAWLERLHEIAVDPATDPEIRKRTVAILLKEMPGILSEARSGRLSEAEHDWEEYGGPRLEGM